MKKKTLDQTKDLKALLIEVDKMFQKSKPKLCSFNYSLNKYPYGWKFSVIKNWHKWLDVGAEVDFGVYEQPEFAVLAFLNYVKKHKINVRELCA